MDRPLHRSSPVEATFGKYRILAELGRGGMADVYLAMVAGPTGSGFSKLSVLKRLRENLAEDPEFVAMLMDEARISARLNHPNVVQSHEIGIEGGSYFLAMEYLDGQPLHRIQKRSITGGARFPMELELLVVSDVLAGLHHAHELADYDGTPLNIVHRDVTPQNVFVTYGGHVKVVDFGIAKAAGRSCETRQGIVKGKLRYMSPEQAMGLSIDRRADLFSVGVLLWEAITGERFWKDQEELDIARALIAGNYDPSPKAKAPGVPDALDAICCRALALSVDDRYETAEEFRTDLDAYLTTLDGVALRRRLGAWVEGTFSRERATIREIIERAGRRAEPMSVEKLNLSRSGSRGSDAPGAASVRPLVVSMAPPPAPNYPATLPAPPSTPPAPVAKKSNGWVMGAGVIGVVAAMGVGAFFASSAGRATAGRHEVRVKAAASPAVLVTTSERRAARMHDAEQTAPEPVVVYRYVRPAPAPRVAPRPQAGATASTDAPAASTTSSDLVPHAARPKPGLDASDPWKASRGGPALDKGDPWAAPSAALAKPTWGK